MGVTGEDRAGGGLTPRPAVVLEDRPTLEELLALVATWRDSPADYDRHLLDALYRLEHRYAADDHPMLSVGDLREAVDGLADDPDELVREAVEAVRTVHGFHEGPSGVDSE